MHFRLRNRSRYPWLFLVLAAAANGAVFTFAPYTKSFELSISATGVIAGFVYFLYSQHLQVTRLFADLFQRFNERYDCLNNKLNKLAFGDRQAPLSPDDKLLLFDYFNLCAEEYLYFKAGYIDEEVWQSWVRGMKFFAAIPEIRRLWEEETQLDSYYGFTLSLVDNVPTHH